MSGTRRREIVAAAGQMPAFPLERASESLASVRRLVARAAEADARLLVLPECAYPAYAIGSPAAYRKARHLGHAAFLAELATLARQHSLHLVCGFIEDTGQALFNSAAVLSPSGELCGVARKSVMWMTDTECFRPAESLRPIDTELGCLGVAICADNRMPEVTATLVARGAEMIVAPACWVDLAAPGQKARNPQPEFIIPARAREFGVAHVCADKVGDETRGFSYVGQSLIVQPDGVVSAIADDESESLIVAAVPVVEPRWAGLPEGLRDKLLAPSPTSNVKESAERPLTLAVVPGGLFGGQPGWTSAGGLLASLARRGVDLVVTHARQGEVARQLAEAARSHALSLVGAPLGEGVTSVAGARLGTLDGDGVVSFAPTRVLALDGAELVCVFAPTVPLGTLRVRAAENHVFVAAVSEDAAILIDTRGRVLVQAESPSGDPPVQTINLAQATDKEIVPMTDIWQQRRPALYEF